MKIIFDTIDNIIVDSLIDDVEFYEFCNNLNRMNSLLSTDLYLSEKVDRLDGKSSTGKNIINNTLKTTKDMAKLYGITTDIGGMSTKSLWDLMMKLLELTSSALLFITKKIVMIPNTITKILDIVSNIPSNVINKIRGNIKLYITVDDIQLLMDKFILEHMMNFISLANQLSKGELWTTMFKQKEPDREQSEYNRVQSSSDMDTIKKMKQEFSYFAMIKFNETIIDMNDSSNVEGYFGKGKIIYKDIYGVQHSNTYYSSLKELINMITARKGELDLLYSTIGNKMKITQSNQSFSNLSQLQRNSVINSMQMISKTIEIIGNIIKYMMQDLNTIQKSTSQITKRQDKINKGTAKKKLVGMSDDSIKDLDSNKEPISDIKYEKEMAGKGYVKVMRFQKDKTGKVTKEIDGIIHSSNKELVWVKKDSVPKGSKIIK